MQRQEGQAPFENLTSGIHWFVFVSQSLAVTVEVFLHKRLGRRYGSSQKIRITGNT